MNAKEYLNLVRFPDRLINDKDKERCKMNKYVSVRELKRKIRENVYSIENDYGFPDDGMSDVDIFKTIDECKKVDIEEVKHAKWENVGDNLIMEQTTIVGKYVKCSECGNEILVARTDNGSYRFSNYCANCGAKMDKEG